MTCAVTTAVNDFLDSAAAKAVEASGDAIPTAASNLAPYGWKVESRTITRGFVKSIRFLEKSNEVQVVLDIAERSSCPLSNSVISKIYDYSDLAYTLENEMNSHNFYSNSVNILSNFTDEIVSYLETPNQKYDFLKSLNKKLSQTLNSDCSTMDDKTGKIYSNVTAASIFYKSLENSDSFSDGYIKYLETVKNDAASSLNKLKNIAGETNRVYVDAKNDYAREFYISAKRKSNDEISQLTRVTPGTWTPAPEQDKPQPIYEFMVWIILIIIAVKIIF